MKFWASRGPKMTGPHPSREAALAAFAEAFPFRGPRYLAAARKNQVTTGYGEAGPHFSIQWHTLSTEGHDHG